MMRQAGRLATIVVAVLAIAACSSGDDDSGPGTDAGAETGSAAAEIAEESSDQDAAGRAAVDLMESYGRGEWGPIYDRLHPAQQALVSQDQYLRCGRDEALAEGLAVVDSIEVAGTEAGSASIAGTDLTVPAVQVSLQLDSSPTPADVTMIYAEGSWRWTAGDLDQMLSC